jgi:hypothetical protein
MDDIVVDTNVFAHTQNPNNEHFSASVTFTNSLLDSDVLLCVDKGFQLDESKNRSIICYEYLQHIVFGSPAYFVILKLAMDGRIMQLDRLTNRSTSRKINQLLANKHDRTFLNVACNSSDKTLVSHDYVDFSIAKRRTIKREIDVDVITAADVAI